MAGVGQLRRGLPGGEPGSVAQENAHQETLLPHGSPQFSGNLAVRARQSPAMGGHRYGARVATPQALSDRAASPPAAFPAGVAAALLPGPICSPGC